MRWVWLVSVALLWGSSGDGGRTHPMPLLDQRSAQVVQLMLERERMIGETNELP